MSTHGCFAPPFSPFLSFWLSLLDVGAQEPDATFDDYYHQDGAYYYVQDADDQE